MVSSVAFLVIAIFVLVVISGLLLLVLSANRECAFELPSGDHITVPLDIYIIQQSPYFGFSVIDFLKRILQELRVHFNRLGDCQRVPVAHLFDLEEVEGFAHLADSRQKGFVARVNEI